MTQHWSEAQALQVDVAGEDVVRQVERAIRCWESGREVGPGIEAVE